MTETTEADWLLDVLRGNEAAVDLCLALGMVSQVWDDVVDEGHSTHINQAMVAALVEIPANPFYRAHFDRLQPLVAMACFDYLASVQLERGSTHDRTLAFVMRDSYAAIVTQCAAIIGGTGYAIAQAPRIRRGVHDEPLSQYLGGLP